MNKEVKIKITNKIHQENDSAIFEGKGLGDPERVGNNWRSEYNEKNKEGDVKIKPLTKSNELAVQRRDIKGDHMLMKFGPGEKQKCKVMAVGKQMNLVSLTGKLDFSKISSGKMQPKVEYDLLSGLYLVGNYTIKIEVTDF